MRKGTLLAAFALALISGCGAGGNQTVAVEAKNFEFELSKTTVKAGKPVEFSVKSAEGKHVFSIDGTSVSLPVGQGETKTAVWTPEKPGAYKIVCHASGAGHAEMSAVITVQ